MKCLILLLLMVNLIAAKQYERCELAKELVESQEVELKDVGLLVCFGEKLSNLDTESLNNGNYGLFKFNSNAWCSLTDEAGGKCNVKCSDFIDDDITDDIKCAKQIIEAEGLDAWGYEINNMCAKVAEDFTKECFENEEETTTSSEIEQETTTVTSYVLQRSNAINTIDNLNEKSLKKDEILAMKIVDSVMNKIALIQSQDQSSTKNTDGNKNNEHGMNSNNKMFNPVIQNFFMFNFNVKDTN